MHPRLHTHSSSNRCIHGSHTHRFAGSRSAFYVAFEGAWKVLVENGYEAAALASVDSSLSTPGPTTAATTTPSPTAKPSPATTAKPTPSPTPTVSTSMLTQSQYDEVETRLQQVPFHENPTLRAHHLLHETRDLSALMCHPSCLSILAQVAQETTTNTGAPGQSIVGGYIPLMVPPLSPFIEGLTCLP
jgi:hypothetical protein